MIAGKDQKVTINGNLVPNCINKIEYNERFTSTNGFVFVN